MGSPAGTGTMGAAAVFSGSLAMGGRSGTFASELAWVSGGVGGPFLTLSTGAAIEVISTALLEHTLSRLALEPAHDPITSQWLRIKPPSGRRGLRDTCDGASLLTLVGVVVRDGGHFPQ